MITSEKTASVPDTGAQLIAGGTGLFSKTGAGTTGPSERAWAAGPVMPTSREGHLAADDAVAGGPPGSLADDVTNRLLERERVNQKVFSLLMAALFIAGAVLSSVYAL